MRIAAPRSLREAPTPQALVCEPRSVLPGDAVSGTREIVMANVDETRSCSACGKSIEPTDSLGMAGDKIMHMICYVRYMAQRREQKGPTA
jgi:hypothetical protein